MKIKTSELSGVQLDWVVAQIERKEVKFECNLLFFSDKLQMLDYGIVYHPSKDWEYGGPIIEREGFQVLHVQGGDNPVWKVESPRAIRQYGPTPLVAAMRCYVTSKLGEEVEVPDAIA